jgi:hypothetical protein
MFDRNVLEEIRVSLGRSLKKHNLASKREGETDVRRSQGQGRKKRCIIETRHPIRQKVKRGTASERASEGGGCVRVGEVGRRGGRDFPLQNGSRLVSLGPWISASLNRHGAAGPRAL